MKSKIKVLNDGYIELVDKMGSDKSMVEAARVSYDNSKNTKDAITSSDIQLLRYLLRNHHTSPFEMAEMAFIVKAPIFVARQWFRHRTGNYNEVSARYTELDMGFYVPEENQVKRQSTDNKQGRADGLVDNVEEVVATIEKASNESFDYYKYMLKEHDVTRELSRCVLPVGAYTKWMYKTDVHNLMHFLRLRMDSHAQYEIRVYADAMFEMFKEHFPVTAQGFLDYRLNAKSLSSQEKQTLLLLIENLRVISGISNEEIKGVLLQTPQFSSMSKREQDEFNTFLGLG